jgi:hypothetical protein
MADTEPNQPPEDLATMYTTHTDSAGIAGQILYPTTEVDSYRAAEFAAGHVDTLEIGEDETWPPAPPEEE